MIRLLLLLHVDGQLLKEQAQSTLQETLRNISGLTQDGNNYGVGDNLAIRGLGVNYTYDGIYAGADLGNSYNPTRSLTNISSIEVLKGPATGLYGTGSAGGIINLIEKKPEFDEAYSIRSTIGQWNTYSLMFDATSAISDDTAYRLVASRESSDGYRDIGSERSEIYGSLLFNFSDSNSLLLSAAYIDDAVEIDSIRHPVRLIDLSELPSGFTAADLAGNDELSLQLSDSQLDELFNSITSTDGTQPFDIGDASLVSPIASPNKGEEFRIKLRHDIKLTDDWSLTQQLQYRSYDSNYIRQTGAFNYVYFNRNGVVHLDPRAPLVVDDELYPYAARRQEFRNVTADETAIQYFADIQGLWSTDNMRGEHLISFNYDMRDFTYQQLSIWDADDGRSDPAQYILDIRDPNFDNADFFDFNPALRSQYDKSVNSFGVSLQEVIYLNDGLTGRIGVAYGGVDQGYQNQITDSTPEFDTDDSGVTYNLGLNYRFTDNLSVFANASKGRAAYSVLGSLNGESDRPDSESESLDLGFRLLALDDNLLASLVFFDTARTNLRYSNPLYEDDPADPAFNINVPEYYFDENDRTSGIELDINAFLSDTWSINFNSTVQDPVTEPGAFATSQEEEQTKGVPEWTASLWTTYGHQFAFLENPLNFSLGVNYEDERSINVSSFGVDYAIVDSYVLWDASVSYATDNWDIQLNLENLTDETYYSKAQFLGGLPGEERNAKLTFNYSF